MPADWSFVRLQAAADAFFAQHAGRPFNSLEPTPCLMAYAKGLALVEPQPAATGKSSHAQLSHHTHPRLQRVV